MGRGVLLAGRRVSTNGIGCALSKDRKSTRLNSSHVAISYAVFCLKKKNLFARSSRTASTALVLFCSMPARTPIVVRGLVGFPVVLSKDVAVLVVADDPAALTAAIC